MGIIIQGDEEEINCTKMREMLIVAGIQMPVTNNVSENEELICTAIEKAAKDKADFLLTPEGSLSGYNAEFDREEVAAALERVTTFAKEKQVGLALGTCYKEIHKGKERCYNQVRIYSPEGEYLGSHSKILRCSSLQKPGTGEMAWYTKEPLRAFEWGGVRFGALICNDFWATPGCTTTPNPYLPWKLQRLGARFILHAVNSGHEQRYRPFHESSVELWASALKIYVVEVNAVRDEKIPINAGSGLVGPDGTRLVSAPDTGEQYFVCEIDLSMAPERTSSLH